MGLRLGAWGWGPGVGLLARGGVGLATGELAQDLLDGEEAAEVDQLEEA